jgi:hypothetical protein
MEFVQRKFSASAQPISEKMRSLTLPFDLKSSKTIENFAGEFTGYAAAIHNIDRSGDMLLPGAFSDTLDWFLKNGMVCWQHDSFLPIGVPIEASEDDYGLKTTARISNTTLGADIMTLIRDRVVKKLSIGYRVSTYDVVNRGGLISYLETTSLSEERKQSIIAQYDLAGLSELYLLKKIKLYEYSPVSFPANEAAVIQTTKELIPESASFADHSATVLAAVRGLRERASSVCAIRRAEGKTKLLNSDRVTELQSLQAEVNQVSKDLQKLLAELTIENQDEAIDRLELFVEYQKTLARLNGVSV